MIFNSLLFGLFICVVLGLYYLPLSWRVRKGILLLASLSFYGAWRPEYLLLIGFSTVVDWWVARAMWSSKTMRARRLFLLISLCSNLGLLAFFKYGNFIVNNINGLSDVLGSGALVNMPDILLPVGISFYTFQTLSYTLDIYRGEMKPWGSFLDFALFVTFFPQLVAGPIVRAQSFQPQCEQPRKVHGRTFLWGWVLFILGLFQKVVLSDTLLAPVVDLVYQPSLSPGFLDSWMGTLAFSGQIYFDFAGYSICAIGVAMMLGFELPDNFRSPYASRGFSDFWRRWHISLSSWLRDYLYISLGGNRCSSARVKFNLFMTMLLGGLWHGASWNFVLWGALHGFFLIGERLLQPTLKTQQWSRSLLGKVVGWGITYALVCIAWVPFRARSFGETFEIYKGMVGLSSSTLIGPRDFLLAGCVVCAMLVAQNYTRHRTLEEVAAKVPVWFLVLILVGMILLTLTNIGTARAFIYFQF